jgi:hypothetical protein
MEVNMQFLRWLYGSFLNLFPRAYREEYGEELQMVFNLSLDDAMKIGGMEVAGVVLRELMGLPTAILYEHLRKPKYGLVAQASSFAKGNFMETIQEIGWADLGSWTATVASLLPLWLLSFAFAFMGAGFPLELAIIGFYLTIPVSIVLLWKGWLTFDLLLYSLFPFILLFIFIEISTSYKTPFILFCALILTIGIIGYQRSLNKDSLTLAWLSLLLAAIATWVLASHATRNYWQMFDGLGFPFGCFPGTQACPLPDNLSPWWVLFFSW